MLFHYTHAQFIDLLILNEKYSSISIHKLDTSMISLSIYVLITQNFQVFLYLGVSIHWLRRRIKEFKVLMKYFLRSPLSLYYSIAVYKLMRMY